MGLNMKESGTLLGMLETEEENKSGLMAVCMRDIGKMIRQMAEVV